MLEEVTRVRRYERLVIGLTLVGAIGIGSAGIGAAQTPGGGVDLSPNPEICNQAPRDFDAVEGYLAASPVADDEQVGQTVDAFVLPEGTDASSEARGGIVETIVQIIACANGGDTMAALGGVSDGFLDAQRTADILRIDAGWQLAGMPQALPEDQHTELLDTREFRQYEDGRVGVLVYYRIPTGAAEAPVQINLMIFQQNGSRWLLDDIVPDLEDVLGDMATPAAG